jgi:hypothetical protein
MSLYIHSENQKMLWDSIHTSPLFNVCFNNEDQKIFWFKNIIRIFYEKSPKKIGNKELTEMNRNTIIYMFKDIKTLYTSLNASNTITNSITSTIIPYTSNYENNQGERIKTIESRLVEKQHEMDSFLNRPTPPEIDFRMVEKDEPILNIDELLQKQFQERNLYQEPQPQQSQPQQSQPQQSQPQQSQPQQSQPQQSQPQQSQPQQSQPQQSQPQQQPLLNNLPVDLSSKLDKLIDMMGILTRFIISKSDEVKVIEEVEKVEEAEEVVEEVAEVVEEVAEEVKEVAEVVEIVEITELDRYVDPLSDLVEKATKNIENRTYKNNNCCIIEEVAEVVEEVKKKRGRGKGKGK